MTDDLLQRLRTLAAENGDIYGQCGPALREAADEIEQLSDRIHYIRENWRVQVDRAESAERERDALRERIDSAQPAEVLDDFDQMGNRCGVIYVETAQIGKHLRLVVEDGGK